MMLAEKIAARTLELAGDIDPRQQKLIETLSTGTAAMLQSRHRTDAGEADGLLVTAGSLYALADYLETEGASAARRFTVGDVTVEPRDTARSAQELRLLAERMTAHLRRSGFQFRGV